MTDKGRGEVGGEKCGVRSSSCPVALLLPAVCLCATPGQWRPFLFQTLPGSLARTGVPGSGSAPLPSLLVLFSHTLHNKGFLLLFSPFFFFWSLKTEETIFTKTLIKNSKKIALGWAGGDMKGESKRVPVCGAVPL